MSDIMRRNLRDDGLPTEEVGRWALRKYAVHAHYATMFATGMKNRWDQLCYLGLCTGPGRVRVRDTAEIVESSAMTALRLTDPFTRYIFCDADHAALEVLRQRVNKLEWDPDVAWIPGDLNEKVGAIRRHIPRFSRGSTLLSMCFLDPYATNIRFDTISALGGNYLMDFLIVLPLGMDARRNLRRYMEPGDTRIEDFLNDPDWRQKLRKARAEGENVIHFLGRRFAEEMTELGYEETAPREMVPIRSTKKNLNLYLVGLFTKSDRGKDFWQKAVSGTSPQGRLDL